MRTPDLAPDRLEELLRGAPPETGREARLEGLVRELRTTGPTASPALRERVRRTASAPPRRKRVPVRALALAAAAVAVVSAGGYALTRGAGGDGAAVGSRAGGAAEVELPEERGAPGPFGEQPEQARPQDFAPEAIDVGGSLSFTSPPPPDAERAREVDMSLELRVRDADAVSAAANEAMRTADTLGGHVAASSVQARGREGEARLTLRVPVARLDDAVVRLSSLGTITAQDVELEDLQARVDRRETRIERLERSIRRERLRLASGTLTSEERLEAELRLESLRAQLRAVRRARAGLLRRAATAEIRLALHTREAVAPAREEGGIAAAVRNAWHVLSVGAQVALFLLIVAGPLLAAGLLVWALVRVRGRRAERRLLDRARPAGARPPA